MFQFLDQHSVCEEYRFLIFSFILSSNRHSHRCYLYLSLYRFIINKNRLSYTSLPSPCSRSSLSLALRSFGFWRRPTTFWLIGVFIGTQTFSVPTISSRIHWVVLGTGTPKDRDEVVVCFITTWKLIVGQAPRLYNLPSKLWSTSRLPEPTPLTVYRLHKYTLNNI